MKYKVMWTGTQAWASDSLILEGIVVEERDEAAGQPKPAVEYQPLRPRQRHLAKQAEDTPFGLFVAENVQLMSWQKHWRSPTRLERRTEDMPGWLLLKRGFG